MIVRHRPNGGNFEYTLAMNTTQFAAMSAAVSLAKEIMFENNAPMTHADALVALVLMGIDAALDNPTEVPENATAKESDLSMLGNNKAG